MRQTDLFDYIYTYVYPTPTQYDLALSNAKHNVKYLAVFVEYCEYQLASHYPFGIVHRLLLTGMFAELAE